MLVISADDCEEAKLKSLIEFLKLLKRVSSPEILTRKPATNVRRRLRCDDENNRIADFLCE